MRGIAVRLAGVLAISLSVAGSAQAEEVPRTASLTTAAKPLLRHGVFRFTSYPQAWTAAQESNRPILVYATAPNCPHCVRMISETFAASPVKRLATDSFETVYVDRAEQPELAAKLKIRYFPTTIVVAPNHQVRDVIEGYGDATTLNQRLKTSFAAHQSATRK
jgi:thioredoxin-like negative regulator of GroEL